MTRYRGSSENQPAKHLGDMSSSAGSVAPGSNEERGEHRANHDELLGESVALLALASLRGVGYWTLWNLKKKGLKLKDVLRSDSARQLLLTLRGAKARIADDELSDWPMAREKIWSRAASEFRQLRSDGIELVLQGDPRFPRSLREIPDFPEWLFVQGNTEALHCPAVAIVGMRKPTPDGRFLADYLTVLVATRGYCIVGGLATGVDVVGHSNAIRFGVPTVAFLGTGSRFPLRASAETLRRRICANGGAVVSEYLPAQGYSAQSFVRRNRLQAALASVTVPIEWRENGGTAHTVRYALSYGRRVIGVRMPDWERDRRELRLLERAGAPIFTVPGDEPLIVRELAESFTKKALGPGQMSLL